MHQKGTVPARSEPRFRKVHRGRHPKTDFGQGAARSVADLLLACACILLGAGLVGYVARGTVHAADRHTLELGALLLIANLLIRRS
jgi:hypothetical protein